MTAVRADLIGRRSFGISVLAGVRDRRRRDDIAHTDLMRIEDLVIDHDARRNAVERDRPHGLASLAIHDR